MKKQDVESLTPCASPLQPWLEATSGGTPRVAVPPRDLRMTWELDRSACNDQGGQNQNEI